MIYSIHISLWLVIIIIILKLNTEKSMTSFFLNKRWSNTQFMNQINQAISEQYRTPHNQRIEHLCWDYLGWCSTFQSSPYLKSRNSRSLFCITLGGLTEGQDLSCVSVPVLMKELMRTYLQVSSTKSLNHLPLLYFCYDWVGRWTLIVQF